MVFRLSDIHRIVADYPKLILSIINTIKFNSRYYFIYSPLSSLYYRSPAAIYGKCYLTFTFLVVLTYRFPFLLVKQFWIDWKTWTCASDFTWFLCIYCLMKLFHLVHCSWALYAYHEIVFGAFVCIRGFLCKPLLVLVVLYSSCQQSLIESWG